MTDIERVKEVINWIIFEKIAKNRKEIAKLLDYTESSFSQIINSKVTLSAQFIKKLSNIDKRINEAWLLTGEGEMLKQPRSSNNFQVGNSNKNINMGFGSQTVNSIEEVNSLKTRITELESQLRDKEALLAVQNEKINGLQNELKARIEMIDILKSK